MRSLVPWRPHLWLFVMSFVGGTAHAQQTEEVARLRDELSAVRREYGERLEALEMRLKTLEGAAPSQVAPVSPTAAAEAAIPAGAAGSAGPTGPLPVYGGAAASSKVFNPDIAVIGDFLGAAGKNQADGAPPALELHEAEASFQAIVDPYARADFFLTFGSDEVGVEEGFLTFPALPGGFLMRVGKMRAGFGKVNAMHNHILPWTDRPLLTQNIVGGEDGFSDAGVSISRLIPNGLFFLEATAEVYRGDSALFKAPRRQDLTYLGRLRGYQDISESTNVDLGASLAYGHNGEAPGLTTRLFGVDATFRYRPLRRAIYRRFLARTEAVWSRREGAAGVANAFGTYGSLEYQFARRWFAGARFDYAGRAADPSFVDKGGSFLLTYWPSEFSQVRGQLRHTRFGEGTTANELLFQFQFSIGAHGAHPF